MKTIMLYTLIAIETLGGYFLLALLMALILK